MFPSRQPLLRLEVRERARAVHGRPARRSTPAARCSADRSSINGMIFQRGNPLDYERWAADPGMADWDYAHCLPYFKKMEDCLAGGRRVPRRRRAARARARAGRRIRCSARSSTRCSRRATRSPTTSTASGRRASPAFDRNVHRGRRLSASGAYLHPVMDRPNLDVVTRANVQRVLFDGHAATGVEYRTGAARRRTVRAGEVDPVRRRVQLAAAAPGVGHRRRRPPARRRGRRRCTTCRASGENLQDHLEVYVQHAGDASRCRSTRCSSGATGRGSGCSGCSAAVRERRTTSRAAGSCAATTRSRYPNLMFHFLPIAVRYDGSGPAGGHGYQVHIGPMYSDVRGSVRITSPDARVKPALRFNYLSTRTIGASGSRRSRVARDILGQPAFADVRRRRDLAGAGGRDGRADPRVGGHGRRDRAAPVVHLRDGHRRAVGRRPADDAGPRRRRAACGRRLGDALRHERQHLRPGDDGGGEGQPT